MRFPVPDAVLEALARLEKGGHQAYLVGGCVRDDYLGIPPKDYDIATSALPGQVRACFPMHTTLDTGLRHGTVTVLLPGRPVEITTFRRDGPYSDGRRPDTVRFSTSLADDVMRRDFTINALAWSPDTSLVDHTGGLRDCDLGLIRAVGNPMKRFREDALRILRALRFAAVLGFQVTPDTRQAMEAALPGLSAVSMERIAAELNLTLTGAYAAQAFQALPRVAAAALPEMTRLADSAQQRALCRVQHTPAHLPLRWAALLAGPVRSTPPEDPDAALADSALAEDAARAAACLTRLKQPGALTDEVQALVLAYGARLTRPTLRLWLARLGKERFDQLVLLKMAGLHAAGSPDALKIDALNRLQAEADRLISENACLHLRCLAVTGDDLLGIGYPQGPALGAALNRLLRMVLTEEAANDRKALLTHAQSWLANPTRLNG